MLLAVQPLQAASNPVTEVQGELSGSDIELRLETLGESENLPEIFPVSPGNNLSDQILDFSQSSISVNQLVVQSPTPEVLVPNPEIIIQDSVPPGATVEPGAPAPPYLPRAVAPPVGDIAISNIDTSASVIDLGTVALVPRLVLREAPVQEVLSLLARAAGLNLIFTDAEGGEEEQVSSTISLDLENEPIQEVFNSVLLISGLTANRRGNTIFVGSRLPDVARNLITRTLRLNQVAAEAASTFLASQGAEVQQLVTPIQEIVDPETQRVVRRVRQPSELRPLTSFREEGSTAPILLAGLTVATEPRLNSVTLIGEPRKVQMATSLLTQLDARRRQVAVNVKIVDIDLLNTNLYNSSFSFGFEDGFFIQDQGSAIFNVGRVDPPSQGQAAGSQFAPPIIPLEDTIFAPSGVDLQLFLDQQVAPFGNVTPDGLFGFPRTARPAFGTFSNPFQGGITEVSPTGELTFEPPNLFQFPDTFLLTLQSEIQSGNAKILTDPTLVVQEGQEATIRLIQSVVESVNTEVDPDSGVRTITPVLADAGLTLTVNIEKIDDNGFIAFSISPTVAAPGATVVFNSGEGSVNELILLNRRELSSGLIRLRDGQTLIVSGVIQESDRTIISKVPVFGDLPILGALFRSTERETERREVIIVVTPQIIRDAQGSEFGYNYTPGQEARELLRRQGFPIQGNP
ncbi:MAG: secretin N-terminal domain-containing protein [Xenococcaceae cyanobacterium]